MALKTSPKQRFTATETNRVDLEKLTNQNWYQEAVAAALAQYVKNVTIINNSVPQQDIACFHAIRGAREFSEMLLTFGDKYISSSPNSTSSLNHNL